MKHVLIGCLLSCSLSPATGASGEEWKPEKVKESEFTARKLDTYQHGVKADWGYAAPQRDTFLVLHPQQTRQQAHAVCGAAFRRA